MSVVAALTCSVQTLRAELPGVTCSQSGGVNCSTAITDLAPGGVISSMVVEGCDIVTAAQVGLKVDHPWVGDLIAQLQGPAGTRVVLLDQVGLNGPGYGCAGADVDAVLDDSASVSVEDSCGLNAGAAVSGTLKPQQQLMALEGMIGSGTWTLRVADFSESDVGSLQDWSLNLTCEDREADLSLDMTSDADVLVEGQSVVTSLTVENLGPHEVSSATVTSTLPLGLEYESDTCAGTFAEGVWTWRAGGLTVGETSSCHLTLRVGVGAPSTLVSAASVSSERSDPVAGNDDAVVSLTAAFFADGFESGDTGAWTAVQEARP
jgi:uncharacterized repeat protein (TIGR01451 family)